LEFVVFNARSVFCLEENTIRQEIYT